MRPTALRGGFVVLSMVVSGCASGPDGSTGRFKSVSGPVAWEVVNAGQLQSHDGTRTRWSYSIVFREKAGTSVQFERIDRGAYAADVATGGMARFDFDRRLDANSELRYNTVDTWGYMTSWGSRQFGGTASLGSVTVERRFFGKDSRGQAVVVPVRVVLDGGFGRASRQPPKPERPLPPAKPLQTEDLRSLAGRWEGYYRTEQFHIPVEATISDNGSVEFGENDPVTNRFSRSLVIRDGRVSYSGRDSGDFTFHEGDGRSVLVGQVTTAATPPATLPLRLEWVGAATARPTPQAPVRLGASAQEGFEWYSSVRTHYKAFAIDPVSGSWGSAWNISSASGAMERALERCRERGPACEVYAIGDTLVAVVSPEQLSAMALAGLHLSYKGLMTTERDGRVESSPVSFYLFRGMDEITGSWTTDDGRASGVVSGAISDTNQATVRMTQVHPCRAEFAGTLSITDGGRTLGGSYAGPGCDGGPLEATFKGVRP